MVLDRSTLHRVEAQSLVVHVYAASLDVERFGVRRIHGLAVRVQVRMVGHPGLRVGQTAEVDRRRAAVGFRGLASAVVVGLHVRQAVRVVV